MASCTQVRTGQPIYDSLAPSVLPGSVPRLAGYPASPWMPWPYQSGPCGAQSSLSCYNRSPLPQPPRFRNHISGSGIRLLGKQFLLVLKLHPVMVPDDIIHPGLLHTAGHPVQMVKASYPSVYIGFSSAGSSDWNSIAMRRAFLIRPLAVPGWILAPWTVTLPEAALKFSYSSSPSAPPSTV